MEIKLVNIENPVWMEILPTQTNLTIACDTGQNRTIEELINNMGKFNPENKYDIRIERKRQKRSKDANAYMWILADKIASAIRDTKENVYRDAVRQVGVFSDVAVQTGEPMTELISTWSEKGIGWFAEWFDTSIKDAGGREMKRVRLYKGSSTYDTKQMSRLLDYIIIEAKDLGIETETPEELEKIKALWGEDI